MRGLRGLVRTRYNFNPQPLPATHLSVPYSTTVPWVYKICASSFHVYTITLRHTFNISDSSHRHKVMSAILISSYTPAYISTVTTSTMTPVMTTYISQAPSSPPPCPPQHMYAHLLMAEAPIQPVGTYAYSTTSISHTSQFSMQATPMYKYYSLQYAPYPVTSGVPTW